MRGLSSEEILHAWEIGAAQNSIDRALTLLAAAGHGDPATLARLPVGERDARLLELRARTFGNELAASVECPMCREPLEFVADCDALASEPRPAAAEPQRLLLDGGEVELRRLDSIDLAAAERAAGLDAASAELVQRAVVSLRRAGQERPAIDLSDGERARIAARLAELDAQADVVFALTCPECGHGWQSLFDVARFVFAEVEAAARRLLREVATLAAAFGWSESAVLALTPARRRAYLELATS